VKKTAGQLISWLDQLGGHNQQLTQFNNFPQAQHSIFIF